MESNLFELASGYSNQGATLADSKPMHSSKSILKAAFDFSLATSFTSYALTGVSSFLSGEEKLDTDTLKKLGLKGEKPLSREQANFKLKAKFYQEEFEKAVSSANVGIIRNLTESIAGSMAGYLLDPLFLILGAGVTAGTSSALKAAKLLPVLQHASTLKKFRIKALTYGATSSAHNIATSKVIRDHVEQPYSNTDLFVDATVGLVFGTAFTPKLNFSKSTSRAFRADAKVQEFIKIANDDFAFLGKGAPEGVKPPLKPVPISMRMDEIISTVRHNLIKQDLLDPDKIPALTLGDTSETSLKRFYGIPDEAFKLRSGSYMYDDFQTYIGHISNVLKNLNKAQVDDLAWFVRFEGGSELYKLYQSAVMNDSEAAKILNIGIRTAIDERVYDLDGFLNLFKPLIEGRDNKNMQIISDDIRLTLDTILTDFETIVLQQRKKSA